MAQSLAILLGPSIAALAFFNVYLVHEINSVTRWYLKRHPRFSGFVGYAQITLANYVHSDQSVSIVYVSIYNADRKEDNIVGKAYVYQILASFSFAIGGVIIYFVYFTDAKLVNDFLRDYRASSTSIPNGPENK